MSNLKTMNNYPKQYILIFFALIFSANLFAQKSVTMGDKYAQKFDFINAIEEYKKALNNDPENLDAVKGIASSYRHIGNYAQSEYWYGKLTKLDEVNNENLFYYAQALMSSKKYDEALKSWQEYRVRTNENYVSDIIDGLEYVNDLAVPNPNIAIKNAGTLNTKASDFGVSFKNLTEIVFCSTRDESEGEQDNWTHEKYTDIYTSVATFDDQTTPIKFNDNQYNGAFHDGPATFIDNTMYLTRSQYRNAKTFKSKADKTVKLEIVEVDLNITSPKLKKFSEDFDFNNKEYSVAHATVSENGDFIIFSSDSEEFGEFYGGTDLYYIQRVDGIWSAPKNLGGIINTPGDEEYPFFSEYNEIHFASNGHYGMGGLDVYKAESNNGVWSNPENLGAPINSSFDDFNYVYNKKSGFGFFSSNRAGGFGSDDIYTFKYINGASPGNNIFLKVIVYDEETLEPLENVTINIPACVDRAYFSDARGKSTMNIDAYSTCQLQAVLDGYFPKNIPFSVFDRDVEIEVPMRKINVAQCELSVCIRDKDSDLPITGATVKLFSKIDNRYYSGKTNKDGCVQFIGIQPNVNYEIVASKEINEPNFRYLSTTASFSTYNIVCPTTINQVMYLSYVQKGVGIEIPDIYYDLDKYFIRPDAAKELDKIVKVLTDNPTIEVELGSHTDCRASYTYNETLSTNRAKAAVEYIVSRGIDASRMTWKGYGESVLRVNCPCEGAVKSNCTEAEHQQNRRTEFKITKF